MHPQIHYWLMAIRPRTLPAGAAPVVLGLGLAWEKSVCVWAALATLFCCILMQVGANLVNDYFDYVHGVDDRDRLGPDRMTQKGLIAPHHMRAGIVICFGLAVLLGAALVLRGGWPIAGIGLISIVAAYLYTGGPLPLSYLGMGEVLAFIFFGPIAVGGTYYLQTLEVSPHVLLAGLGPGFLSAMLMSVNNLRDTASDTRTGKRTVAVMIGEFRARQFSLGLLVAAGLVALFFFIHHPADWPVLAAPTASLLYSKHWKALYSGPVDKSLNQVLAATGQYMFVYSLLFAVGITI